MLALLSRWVLATLALLSRWVLVDHKAAAVCLALLAMPQAFSAHAFQP